MKPDSTNTPTAPAPPAQWQGMDEYLGSPEFLAAVRNEFPEDAAEFADPVSRRRFLGLMGASIALTTGAGCNLRPAPQRLILPYTVQPDQVQPGVPLFFATAAPHGGYGHGVLVRSHEGRPVKVEGNPDHPSSLGGADLYALASVLDLYDPDRSKTVIHRGIPAPFEEAVQAVRRQLYDVQGRPKANVRLRVLTGTVTSPTLAAHVNRLLADFPQARWAQHEPAAGDGAREGTRKAFGSPKNVTYDFAKADVILALDADFLGCGSDPGSSRYSREFGDRRKIRAHGKTLADIHGGKKDEKKAAAKKDHDHDHDDHEGVRPEAMNRLYVVEAMPTPTGSSADHRLALASSQVEGFVRALARKLGVGGVPAGGEAFDNHPWLTPLADDLVKSKGKSVVLAGDRQPASVHAAVAAINASLGNAGQTVRYSAPVEFRPDGKVIDLRKLTEEMNGRGVDVLLILGSNPAYSAPADVPFADAVKNVPFTFHLGTHLDETAVLCQWHVNEAHYLEAWGDVRGHDGTVAIQQPLIAPLHQGRSALELLAAIGGLPDTLPPGSPAPDRPREGYDIVRAFWQNTDEVRKVFPAFPAPEAFEVFWQESVRSGVVAGTGPVYETPALAGNWAEGLPAPAAAASGDAYEIDFRPDPTIFDGRYANNGWLQELPKPVTKLTWDNAAFVSPKTAEKLSVDKTFRWTGGEHGRAEVTVLELKVKVRGEERKLRAPAWVLPNHPDGVVTVHLGYGRPRAGNVNTTPADPNPDGQPYRGFNAYALRTSDAPWFAPGLTLAATKDTYFLACTQGQTSMSQTDTLNGHVWDRKPVRHGDVALYKQNPAFAKIPPTAAGETDLINKNVPGRRHGPPDPESGVQERAGSAEGHDHSHGKNGKDDKHDDHGHDKRLTPLTMYHPNNALIPGYDKLVEKGQARRWGMAIDLNACTGCSACVVACQGENNVPVVGKDQVTKGRAMHWIRIDRYYEGRPDDAAGLKTLFQPLMCVQCEKAPCEVVCPVAATVHSYDGLNDMVYNRCVGTRYCSNNCPYKVRRFNFLQYQDFTTSTLNLGRNPDVTVRSRGVMEKCTFCVQRIRGAEIVAEREFRRIKDGEILTACQSACPTGAIVFGDLNDPDSAVGRWKDEPRNYGLLAELNTMPRLTHLAVVRNPNPAMPKGA